MWIFPVSPEDLAHPKECAYCGAPVILAKNEKNLPVAINADFKVLETLSFGEDGYLQLLADEAAHARTCEKTAATRPAMTKSRRRKREHVDI
jgi:hypothetical protein